MVRPERFEIEGGGVLAMKGDSMTKSHTSPKSTSRKPATLPSPSSSKDGEGASSSVTAPEAPGGEAAPQSPTAASAAAASSKRHGFQFGVCGVDVASPKRQTLVLRNTSRKPVRAAV